MMDCTQFLIWARGLLTASIAVAAQSALAKEQSIEVPSGQPVTFHEMLWDRPGGGLIFRYRFLAPEIGNEGREYEDVELDMQHLCETYAIPRLAQTGPQPSQIVISLGQSETEFGEANPDVIQFFEAYRVEDGFCILEFF